ncbi:hypothetical protein [Curtobacterium sp. CFBP9011]|uniref:hypothetical protein n=1 Tax=Curtobacterium sp. CFBP9011 TaxID=3096530 RepID=UPI002A69E96C|nr:hypothetical protein [Curtobacterium sp. CFBP9011]MDY1006448.1 hypothetical protein [Curtobacterium sp. CFBP9011]
MDEWRWQLLDGDEGGGFHVLEASQSDSRTEGFALASSAANGNDSWADALRRFSPDLITSMWGTNDYGKVTPAVSTQQQAVSTFRSADPGVAIGFFDLGAYVPPYFGQTGAKDNPYMSDGIHASDTGYDVITAIPDAYFTSTPA